MSFFNVGLILVDKQNFSFAITFLIQIGQKGTTLITNKLLLVPGKGLEPPRPCGHRTLNPARLPFRHPGIERVIYCQSLVTEFYLPLTKLSINSYSYFILFSKNSECLFILRNAKNRTDANHAGEELIIFYLLNRADFFDFSHE